MEVLRQALARFLSPVSLVLTLVAALIVGLSGPFGTYLRLGLGERLLYWSIIALSSAMIGHLIEALVNHSWARRPVWMREIAIVILFTGAFTPPVLFFGLLIGGVGQSLGWIELALFVAFVAIILRLLVWLDLPRRIAEARRGDEGWNGVERRRREGAAAAPLAQGDAAPPVQGDRPVDSGAGDDPAAGPEAASLAPSPAAPPTTPPGPRLVADGAAAARLSPLLRRLSLLPGVAVMAMSNDDHYVEVHDSSGHTHRLLMRFSDAVEEARSLDGILVHRSHWVAREAVRGQFRRAGRDFVMLHNGREVPVSRTYRAALSAALPEIAVLSASELAKGERG